MSNIELPAYGLRTILANNHVFYTDFSSKARLELSLQVGENFKKIKFLFQELETDNEGKKRQKNKIEVYFDPQELLGTFVPLIQNGTLKQLGIAHLKKSIEALKNGSKLAPMAFYTKNGGTRNKRPNNVAEYREMRLERSNLGDQYWNSTNPKEKERSKRVSFVLRATECDGEERPQSGGRLLIVPKKVNNGYVNATTINFPLTESQLQAIAYSIIIELQAYRSSQYVIAEVASQLMLLSDKIDQLTASSKAPEVTVKASDNSTNEKEPEPKTETKQEMTPKQEVQEIVSPELNIDNSDDFDIDFADLPF